MNEEYLYQVIYSIAQLNASKIIFNSNSEVSVMVSQMLNQQENAFFSDLSRLSNHLREDISAYKRLESNLSKGGVSIFPWSSKHLTSEFHVKSPFDTILSIPIIIKKGIIFKLGGELNILEYTTGISGDYGSAFMEVDVGHIEAQGEATIKIFEGKNFEPSLNLGLMLEGSVLSAELTGMLGDENVNWTTTLSGDLLNAEAGAMFNLDKEGIELEAGAEACLAKGEAETAINFFGAKISFTGEASIGSIGGSAHYASGPGRIEFGGSASFLAGLGFDVVIEY